MKYFILIIACFSFGFSFCQDKPLPSKAFHFSKPKSVGDTQNPNEMKSKSIKSSDIVEEEEEASGQTRVIRRVGTISNIPGATNTKLGGTKNPGYNPNLREAAEKRKAAAPPPVKTVTPLGESAKKAEPSRMKVAPSVDAPKK